MPVTLHHVDQARWEAEEQVRIDLVRIYEDAPQERMPDHQSTICKQNYIEARAASRARAAVPEPGLLPGPGPLPVISFVVLPDHLNSTALSLIA